MNADLKDSLAGDANLLRFAEALQRLPQARVRADFAAGVMAEIRASRRRAWLSAPTVFAAAASLVALFAVGVLFRTPLPHASYADWVRLPRTVRLVPYDPAAWYSPISFRNDPSPGAEEPLCTRTALAAWSASATMPN